MENNDKETFKLTYSAKQQEEINSIRKKYITPEENSIEKLRRLDAGVTNKATFRSITLGAIGVLIMGIGMSLSMTEIGSFLGDQTAMLAGCVIGIVGIAAVSLAYPVYNITLAKERKRIAPEIIRLTDELMK